MALDRCAGINIGEPSLHTAILAHLVTSDVITVNACVSQPSWAWLEALRPNGRLILVWGRTPIRMAGREDVA